ncbi:MAG: DUF1232 domain-containing protein [Alphaproteobacteria bacterium]|nr:DUF1232 domain-containing protein [Alphaproteobacteria bacterium]
MKQNATLQRLREWARLIKRDVVALYIAARDPRVPWLAKTVAALVAAYALSPIDLIPDFIPVIGYLDDIILVPLGILLAVKLVPDDLMVGFRTEADLRVAKPISRSGAISVIVIWLAAAALAALWFLGTPV